MKWQVSASVKGPDGQKELGVAQEYSEGEPSATKNTLNGASGSGIRRCRQIVVCFVEGCVIDNMHVSHAQTIAATSVGAT